MKRADRLILNMKRADRLILNSSMNIKTVEYEES